MKKTIILILISLVLNSCIHADNNPSKRFFDPSISVDTNNIPIKTNQVYLPLKVFPNSLNPGQDTFLINWYSKHLRAMNEPLLFNKKSSKELYRLLDLPTFENPYAIIIENENDIYTLSWKVCNGMGGYDPGKLVIDQKTRITKKEWKEIKAWIRKINFWTTNTYEDYIKPEDAGETILEGVNTRDYHVVISPQNEEFYDFREFLRSKTVKIDDHKK